MSDNPWNEKTPAQPEASASETAPEGKSPREWRLIEKLVMGLHAEQRKTRRWGIFFKSLTFLYLFALLGFAFMGRGGMSSASVSEPHTAVVEVKGVIADDEPAGADALITALRRAFEAEAAQAVVLRINSPGGSPVQSGYVYDEVKRLRALHPEKKVYAVIADIGASGAYYIAASADEIYADKASLVGSIGVVSSGFGFVDLMDKLGVERRALTSGEHKAMLDPFSPLDEKEKQYWQSVLDTTHAQFIDQVKKGRGDRLKDDPKLFSGLVWSGEQAVELGLIDGLGSTGYVAREKVGAAKLVDYTVKGSKLEQLLERFSASFAKSIATEMGLNKSMPLQ